MDWFPNISKWKFVVRLELEFIRGEGRHAWRRQKAGGRSRLRVVAMEEVDMDIDEEDEVASRQASCASSSSSSSAMDWLETPAYWTGWGTRSLDQGRRVHVIVDTNVLVDTSPDLK